MVGRTIAYALSLVLLLVSGLLGVFNGITEWGTGQSPWQVSVTVGVFIYGMLGLVTAFGLFQSRRWSLGAAIAWGITVTYVATVAAVAYAGADASILGAIVGGMATALIALGVVWTVRVVTRDVPGIARSE
jgi:hypothetical protein